MSDFYLKMYQVAELDYQAAKFLASCNLFVHSIYFYAQTFEKVNKSIISLYMSSYQNTPEDKIEDKLKHTYGHKLIKSTIGVLKSLTKQEQQLYISRGGKETDDFIQNSISSIEELKNHKFPIKDLIVNFFPRVEFHYEILYKSLYVRDPQLLDSRLQSPSLKEVRKNLERPEWERIRSMISQPSKRYIKLIPITWLLSPLLEQMDLCTRYPMNELENNNIDLLMGDKNSKSCEMLYIMLGDYMSVVQQVWEKIRELKKDPEVN